MVDGFLLIDKESGWTSHDVVAKVRGILGVKKVGHAGTLDPLATGLLVLGVGRATRLLRFVQEPGLWASLRAPRAPVRTVAEQARELEGRYRGLVEARGAGTP